MVEIRLHGLPDEVKVTVKRLRETFDVLEESEVYPDRQPSKFVRQYIKVGTEPVTEVADGSGS